MATRNGAVGERYIPILMKVSTGGCEDASGHQYDAVAPASVSIRTIALGAALRYWLTNFCNMLTQLIKQTIWLIEPNFLSI